MASFGESFVDAYIAGKQMKRQREEDARKRKLEADIAAAVKPGDIIGPKGRAPTYDAASFSTDAGVSIGDRPLSDFQPPASMANAALPAAGLAAPAAPSAQARAMRPAGLSPMSQLPPALAGEAGIVRPTALATVAPPAMAALPVGPAAAVLAAPAAAMPVVPLGHSVGAQPMPAERRLPDSDALPDPEKMVFYKDPLTGKGMAVEATRAREATPADAAMSMAAVYRANGDAAKATELMSKAYDMRSADFEAEQNAMRRAIISATTRHGGWTPAAFEEISNAYNDMIPDGVTLRPVVGPEGKMAMGLGMQDGAELFVDPTTGGVSRTPVFATGAEFGNYYQTLISGNWAQYQANVINVGVAKAAAARQDAQLANDTRRVAVDEGRLALSEDELRFRQNTWRPGGSGRGGGGGYESDGSSAGFVPAGAAAGAVDARWQALSPKRRDAVSKDYTSRLIKIRLDGPQNNLTPEQIRGQEMLLANTFRESFGMPVGEDPNKMSEARMGSAATMAPSYMADLRAKGRVAGVIEAAFDKYPQMAEQIAELAGPEAMRAYSQRMASRPSDVAVSPSGVRRALPWSPARAYGQMTYDAGLGAGDRTARVAADLARAYGPGVIERYTAAARPGAKPFPAGETRRLLEFYKKNDAFRRMVPQWMARDLDALIAAER